MRKELDTLHECLAGVCHQFRARPQDGSTGRGRAEHAAHRSAHFTLGCQQPAVCTCKKCKNCPLVQNSDSLQAAGRSSAQLCKQEAGAAARQHTAWPRWW